MGLGLGLLDILGHGGFEYFDHAVAFGLVKAQLRQAGGKMLGQVGLDVDHVAIWVVDDQAAGVEMHLAADTAGQERIGPAVFAIADDGMADRRHVDAQLVGAACERLELNPGGAVAGPVDHPVAAARGLAFAAFVDHHLFTAGAGLLAQRQVDQALLDIRHADHQRPIDLACGAARKPLGEIGSAARRAGDQEDARGILVEPVDQPRARAIRRIGIEQAIDVLERAAAALRGKARRLVKHDRGAVLGDHHRIRQCQLFFGQRLALAGLALGCVAAGGDADDLSRRNTVGHIGALAIDPDLSGPSPAADRGKADLRQVALEPAVQPDAVIVMLDGELADGIRRNEAAGGHANVLARARPASNPATPPASEREA